MAGLSGKQAVVDVVAAAARLVPPGSPELPTEGPVRLEPRREVPTEIAAPPDALPRARAAEEIARCALGHENHRDFRFCAACGLPMGADLPAGGSPMRPRPEAELTPAERAERERQHQQAMAAAARFESAPQQYVPSEGEAVLIHFVADGLTAFGTVWYRGQELSIGPDHPRWPEARTWITMSRWEQIERWGEQKFDFGPWPGRRSYTEAAGGFEQLMVTGPDGTKAKYSGPTEEQLRQADEAEARRGRAVPAVAVF